MVSRAIDERLLERIQAYVSNDVNSKLPPIASEKAKVQPSEVSVVHFTRILNNWQALCSIENEPVIYYALTHDGTNEQTIVRKFTLRSTQEAII